MDPLKNYTKNQFVPFLRTKTAASKVKIYDFYINDNKKNIEVYKHKNNYIRTTKYTLLSFIPNCIFFQFIKLSNVYFLICAIIQSIPIITTLSNITSIAPFVFLLLVSIIRELIADISRYNYDKQSNREQVLVYRNNAFITSTAETLRAGELIYIKDDSMVPADILLIDSSLNGLCYIKTSSIDREKGRLKEKNGHKSIADVFCSRTKTQTENNTKPFNLSEIGKLNIKGFCHCDYPNANLNHIDGKMSLAINDLEVNIPIDISQMVLRGSVLKMTGWIMGIVIYTGMDSKLFLNFKKPISKISQIERKMNKVLIFLLLFEIIICAGCALYNKSQSQELQEYFDRFLYFEIDNNLKSFLTFFKYQVLLNTLIPISLMVTLEIVKMLQGLFIHWDTELYSSARKRFCKAANVRLNEELGYVNYIFTDKTGTLTSNKMEFKCCVIGDVCYKYVKNKNMYMETEVNNKLKDSIGNLSPVKQIRIQSRKSQQNQFHFNKPITQLNWNSTMKNKSKTNIIPFKKNHFSFKLTGPTDNEEPQPKPVTQDLATMHEFWQALACCHECVCSDGMNGIEYSGMSPDDVELVRAAADQGYSYQKSFPNIRRLLIGNVEKEMKILSFLSFTSSRSRMSIILEDGEEIKLYIKGADIEIRNRLSSKSKHSYLNTSTHHSEALSAKGYRTLMVGYKIIPYNEYNDWKSKLEEAGMNDNEKKKPIIEELYDAIERDILLLGTTMVEDKLQNSVPQTIRDFQFAGIKIWVLTGDKVKTAENVALSSNLITKGQKVFKICSNEAVNTSVEKSNSLFAELEQFIIDFHAFANLDDDNFWYLNSSQSENNFSSKKKFSANPFNIIIEGALLAPILEDENFKSQFLKIALCAKTVICCRVSPLQKALAVRKVKEFDRGSTILAIGDGDNDVSMITEAHIGVGIYGDEGLRAVNASDYAIGEFRLLRRLLFTHGRTNTNRISRMILYFFYKNFFFSFTHFFYCFYSIGSGQAIIDDWFIIGFNLLFTALPLGVQALTDVDLNEYDGAIIKDIMPLLYIESRDGPLFTYLQFIIAIGKGCLLSAINFYTVTMACSEGTIDSNGNNANLWYCSVLLFTSIVVSVSITLVVTQRYITIFLPLTVLISTFGVYLAFVFIIHHNESFKAYGTMLVAFRSPNFYITLLLICIIGFVVDYSWHCSQYFSINRLSTKLMRLRNCDKLNEAFLHEIIVKAKQKFDIMDKSNHYNTVANTSISCNQIHIPQRLEDLRTLNLNQNQKKNKYLKHTLEPLSAFNLKKLEQPFNNQVNRIFKFSSYDGKNNSLQSNFKQKALETKYPSIEGNINNNNNNNGNTNDIASNNDNNGFENENENEEEFKSKERNLSSNTKMTPNKKQEQNSRVVKMSIDSLN